MDESNESRDLGTRPRHPVPVAPCPGHPWGDDLLGRCPGWQQYPTDLRCDLPIPPSAQLQIVSSALFKGGPGE